MSGVSEQRLLDKGLEIANKLQLEALFGKSEFQENLYAFLTVAELLNRNDDIKWAKGEIRGGFDELPDYRLVPAKLWDKKHQVVFSDGSKFFDEPNHSSYSALLNMMNDKSRDNVTFSLEHDQIQEYQKKN